MSVARIEESGGNTGTASIDAGLRELFRIESTDRLRLLDVALSRLQQAPEDTTLLGEAFRETHSLKGAARMLGLAAMQAAAHRLEDELDVARVNGRVRPEAITRLLRDLAELRRLGDQFCAGARTTTPAIRFSGPHRQSLATVFSLFPGQVRDLARSLGKDVELSIDGADTSADQTILDGIRGPLMHLLRNALHHGIESPARRVACGKPRAARLHIAARVEAGALVISMSDDGPGLDEAAIRAVAARRGIATEAELDDMTPGQLRSLIFAPGLSTVSLVTDLAGRGVGLDVVRTSVERLQGSVTVHSEAGRGTCFVMRIPATPLT